MPDVDGEDYGAELRALVSGIQITLQTQTKVDENELRRQAVDHMPRILEAIRRIENKTPSVVVMN